jgi:N-acetylneuraminic acid mutarotase
MWQQITHLLLSVLLIPLSIYYTVATFKERPNRTFQETTTLPISEPTGAWQRLPNLPQGRYEFGAATIGETIYIVGGMILPTVHTISRDLSSYDVENGTWKTLAPLPQPVHHPGVVTHEGKLYVIGGYNFYTNATNAVFVYDPQTNAWQRKADLPKFRAALGVGVIGDNIYAFGGTDHGTAYGDAFVYDIAADSWSILPNVPIPVEHVGYAVADNTLYAVGGLTMHWRKPLSTLYAFNPQENRWQKRTDVPVSISGTNVVSYNGVLLMIGGQQAYAVSDKTYEYSPQTNEWVRRANLPSPRYGGAAVVAPDGIHFLGGQEMVYGTHISAEHFLFEP